jgi:predicted O-methyltransferase YrrM
VLPEHARLTVVEPSIISAIPLETWMNIDQIEESVRGIPHMKRAQAETITNLIIENKFKNILELGFRHGVSTCYMAGALDELGCGQITTVDRISAREVEPDIEQLLDRLNLSRYVEVYYEPTSYIWRLMKMLESNHPPCFDFCYLDGAHDWYTDGFAFFLVDKLLMEGGLIVFDDLDWTYRTSPALKDKPIVKRMPKEEQETPQVRKVFELLVKTHPGYTDFKEAKGWAYATKKLSKP